MKPDLSAAARVALRVLLRSAEEFDRQPVMKALICRHPDVHPGLPANLDSAIATFLGGELRTHYLPSGTGCTDSLRATVLAMYRSPPLGCDDVDTPLACMRYLGSLLRIGLKHSLTSTADSGGKADTGSAGFQLPPAQLLPFPEQGCVLLAHPLTGTGEAETRNEEGAQFTFARAAMLVCGHSTSLGTYALCLNKPLPVKAGALVLGSPLTRALIGELFSWPQSEQEASRQLLRRWQAMHRLHRADPELGLGEQIEAAETLDVDPYTRLRLLLHEKGWFDQAAAAAAAAAGQAEEAEETMSGNAGSHTQPSASTSPSSWSSSEAVDCRSTPKRSRHESFASLQPQHTSSNSDAPARQPVQTAASQALGGGHAAVPQTTTSADAHRRTQQHREESAALVQLQTDDSSQAATCNTGSRSGSSSQSAKEQRAEQRRAEADRSWDAMLLRFAQSSLFKGGPLPSLQVLHRAAALGGQPVLPPSQADGTDGLFLGTTAEGLEEFDPELAADMHFFVGDAMWQPDQLEAESARGCWIAVSPPAMLRDPQGFRRGLGSLWGDTLHRLGGEFAKLPLINKAVVDDLKSLEL